MEDYVVEMRHISKEFSGIIANRDTSLKMASQEIHALLGENGSGKTSLMCILAGSIIPDKGEIYKNNHRVIFKRPSDALDCGIGMVDKNVSLIDSFTALENIVIGVEPTGHFKKMRMDLIRKDVERINERYQLKIDLDKKVALMNSEMKFYVAIAKLLYRQVEVFLFDEPFFYLNPEEAENFKVFLLKLANEGKSILITSRKVQEVRDIADKCTILKDGNCLGTVSMKDADDREIDKLIFGREALPPLKRSKPKVGEAVLCVRNLSVYSKDKKTDIVNKVNFDVKAGEVTCILGMVDSGNIELLYGIGGILPVSNGHVIVRDVDLGKYYEEYKPVNGKRYVGSIDITKMSIRRKNLVGLSQVPSDNRSYGIIDDFNLMENMILQRYCEPEFSKGVFLNQKKIKEYTEKLIDQFEIEAYPNEPARHLSELSRQKLMLAREIDRASKIFIAMRPTFSLDFQASQEIRKQIIRRRDSGTAVLMASNDIDEALKFSDRLLVMYKGRFVADIRTEEADEEKLKMYMSGLIRMKNMHLYDPIISRKKIRVSKKKIKTRLAKSHLDNNVDSDNVIVKKIVKKTIVHRRKVIIPSSKNKADFRPGNKGGENGKLSVSNSGKKIARTAEELKRIRMKNLVQFRDKEISYGKK